MPKANFRKWFKEHVSSHNEHIPMDESSARLMGSASAPRDDEGRKRMWAKNAHTYPKFIGTTAYDLDVQFLQTVGLRSDAKITSLGSGWGVAENYAAKHIVPKGRLILVDFVQEMTRQAELLSKRAGVNNVKCITAHVHNLPIPNNSQNAVAMLGSCRELISTANPIDEIKRILIKSGESRLIIADVFADHEEARKVVHKLVMEGFDNLDIRQVQLTNSIAIYASFAPRV